jgi:hypothetical protein
MMSCGTAWHVRRLLDGNKRTLHLARIRLNVLTTEKTGLNFFTFLTEASPNSGS